MIIKKITIKNFRSYYGEQTFEFSNRLNLILGANGDGKTTLFDAINWAFATDGRNMEVTASSLVSQKFFYQLPPAGAGEVRVSLYLRHDNHDYIVERSFLVSKDNDGKMRISSPKHIGYMSIPGVARSTAPAQDLIERKGVFPAIIKKYCLFKGEAELDIFKDQKTLINLINLFSEVKDFDPFKDFSSYAERLTNQARERAKIKDRDNAVRASKNRDEAKQKEKQLASLLERRKDWKQSYSDYDKWISDLDNSRNTIELVHGIQEKINLQENEKINLEKGLDENYSIKLLDDLWILYGFNPILEEYANKAQSLFEERQTMKQAFDYEQLKKKAEREAKKDALKAIEKEFAQLPWFIPDIKTMQEMLKDHRCKVCGTEAPEGSAPYEFMRKRLEEAIANKRGETQTVEKKDESIPALFENDYISQLRLHAIHLYDYSMDMDQIGEMINKKIETNDKIHESINFVAHQIQNNKDKISEIIAQSASGVDVDNYYDLFTKLTNWSKGKEETNEKIADADRKIPVLRKEIEQLDKEYNKYVGKEGQIYADMYTFFSILCKSLDKAESASFDEFLEKLQDEANRYISILNVDDFTGYIDIYNNGDGRVFLQLIDKNGKLVEHPNTSLETTMHISILLAISELTKKERENEYPLIFDAPTSTFDEGKDSDFYACLNSKVEKQCIVVTKSFLNRNKDGEYELDEERLKAFDCPIYRIKKKSGFDQKDLSTIETIVEPYKNKA